MSLTFTILGCGNSSGVPSIGNYWGQCDPAEAKNRRTRSSLLIQSGTTNLIIDTGPDFKFQLNRADINRLDAVLYSHAHSDHVAGIDELRVLRYRMGVDRVKIYCNSETYEDLERRYDYLLHGGKADIYPAVTETYTFKESDFGKTQTIGNVDFIPFLQDHGTCQSVGYRFGDLAYSVDMLALDDQAIEILQGIETWIVDAAGYTSDSNPVHANLDTIYTLNDKICAKNVYLTSLTLSMDYKTLENELKDGYLPAYDGLIIGSST
ncbi:MAG: MBL fold metallo-hydrolase [Alphaproteobacteria bacterium]|nr:MBL fold metallo-hydrolase [Alphaproteobacteria bacterium]